MKAQISESPGRIGFSFSLEPGDGQKAGKKARMAKDHCHVILPETWTSQDLHPDLLGLSILLLVYPFSAERIEMPKGVSPRFAAVASEWAHLDIGPVDPTLASRQEPANGVPGLAFSGGMDSTAAVLILPKETCLFFLDRCATEGRTSNYSSKAAEHACASLAGEGRDVNLVSSNLEELRAPIGFPVDWANAVPLILMADHKQLDCAAFGTVMESAYRTGHATYLNALQWEPYLRWSPIFQAAALPLGLPVAGLSEVATSSIVLRSPYRSIAQACVRGTPGNPCMHCYKCFRKQLLQAALGDHMVPDTVIDGLLDSREVQAAILHHPVKHENVIAYTLARYHGAHPVLSLLGRKIRCNSIRTDWMERWYRPSDRLIPRKYRDAATSRILESVKPMTAEDEEAVRAWRVPEESAETKRQDLAIIRALKRRGLRSHSSGTPWVRLLRRLGQSQPGIWIRGHSRLPERWLRGILRRLR